MSTYTQIIYQIVFSTRNRKRILNIERRPELFKYITGVIKNKNCHLYCINGVEDHIHILTHLHPTVSLASLVKDIKISSIFFIEKNRLFKGFQGWQEGYGAFTYSLKEAGSLVVYINSQEEHHKTTSFKEEYLNLLKYHQVEFDERFLL